MIGGRFTDTVIATVTTSWDLRDGAGARERFRHAGRSTERVVDGCDTRERFINTGSAREVKRLL